MRYTVSIGIVIPYIENVNGKLITKDKFNVIGSGLLTYVHVKDSLDINTVVTAGHVVKYFRDNKNAKIYIRPSWADTISTTDYLGVSIPLLNMDNTPNTFLDLDPKVDLGCILFLDSYLNKEYIEYTKKIKNPVFRFNDMTSPYLGNQVWVLGYPGHIESQLPNYAICTLKPGYIAWRPDASMTNSDLKHITLLESNASYGNSGGPVFSLINEKVELVGILTGGYSEQDAIYLNGKPIIDTATKQAAMSQRRTGVSIMEKAQYVRILISDVKKQILKLITQPQKK
jgi:hypothetical protein